MVKVASIVVRVKLANRACLVATVLISDGGGRWLFRRKLGSKAFLTPPEESLNPLSLFQI